jgi:two-component system chemotaxis response regulator CheY
MKSILIVDDSALARRRARSILEGEGYQVTEAVDGISALETYYLARPDIVLLDLVMKGMYGLDVLTKLRELDGSAKVIVVSADVQQSSHDLVSEAGATGFLTKPLDAEEVLTLIRTTLNESPQCS